MQNKKSFVGARSLVLKEQQLNEVQFEAVSPAARKILERSRLFYKEELLSREPEKFRQAVLGLAKAFFTVK